MDSAEARVLAEDHGMIFMEVSAADKTNLDLCLSIVKLRAVKTMQAHKDLFSDPVSMRKPPAGNCHALLSLILHYICHYSCYKIKTQLGLGMISGQITHPLEKLFKQSFIISFAVDDTR